MVITKTKLQITQEPLIALCHVIPSVDYTEIMHISTCETLMIDQLIRI